MKNLNLKLKNFIKIFVCLILCVFAFALSACGKGDDDNYIYPNSTLDTVEIKEENSNLARENLKVFGGRVEVFCQDAKDFIETKCKEKKKYDFIFLDGPKGQYVRYLPILKELLESGGVLVADNVYFHGMVKMEGKIPHKHRSIVNNLRQFINDITLDTDFQTTIYDIGDGISVSYKK